MLAIRNGFTESRVGLNGNFSLFEDTKLSSILRHGSSNDSMKIIELLRALEDMRNMYNISVIKECDRSDYCTGEFREILFAYNRIHGYVSLLVRYFTYDNK